MRMHHPTHRPGQSGRITRGQLLAILVILIGGLVAGIFIYRSKAPEPAGTEGSEEHGHGHAEAKGHADDEHHGKETDGAHEEAKGHSDEEHHERPGEQAKPEAHAGEAAHAHGEGGEEPVRLNAEQIKAAGIQVGVVKAGEVRNTVSLAGEIKFNEDRTAHVVPQLAGVVQSVAANLGQQVKKGQVLAVISSVQLSEQRSEWQTAQKRLALAQITHDREKKLFDERISPEMDYLQARQALREAEIAVANASQKLKAIGASPRASSLSGYELRAPFAGMIVEKHIALGEAVKEDANVFTLTDLSTVWAEVSVPAKDLPLVRVGDKVSVRSTAFDEVADGTVAFVSALIGEQTRTAKARVTLSNPKLAWRPGLFVNVAVTSNTSQVPVSVASGAVQTLEGRQVVFVETPGGFKAVNVQVGRSDPQRTEIVKGLKAGDRYAEANSFVIKAEIGKASAEHEH